MEQESLKSMNMVAEDAKQAISMLNTYPDLILLDINMPEMDGLELCKIIRNNVACPILFLTARITEQDKINGLQVGGDDYTMYQEQTAALYIPATRTETIKN